jgi:hypothetical protein
VADAPRIEIESIQVTNIRVPIIGTSPLIVHNFSEKSKRQMLAAQQGKRAMKEVRDPETEYQAAFYWIHREGQPNGYGFPVVGVKAAIVGAARFYGKAIKMTELRQFLFMRGILTKADPQELVEIHGTPEMREDIVRLGGMSRSADLRYRPEFKNWSATLDVTYVHSSLSQGSVLSLIDAAGLGIGIGEWRPEKRGTSGTWKIDQDRDIEVIK